MRSQRSIVRKAAKARARRRDYAWRRNINNNVPTIAKEERKEVYTSKHIPGAALPELRHVGYKVVIVKEKDYRFKDPNDPSRPLSDEYGRAIGMIQYPKLRKHLLKTTVK